MMKKNHIGIAIISILFFLTLSGCTGGFMRGGSDTLQTYDFRRGTDGLSMEFLQEMPPDSVFVGSDFATALRIKNMGSYDIDDRSDIKISVPDRSAFLFKEEDVMDFYLRGRSLYAGEGEEDIMTFPMRALCFPGFDGTRRSVVTNYSRKIKATACYYYETTTNKDICVDTLKFTRQSFQTPECEMETIQLSGGQGGPVGVTRIAPTLIPESSDKLSLQISIIVKKLGGTEYSIYNPESGCDYTQQDKVEIRATIGGEEIECEPAIIDLSEQETVSTICKKEVDKSQGAYLTPLTIDMSYYVQQKVLKQISVNPPPGDNIDCAAIGGERSVSLYDDGPGSSDRCAGEYPGYNCRQVQCNLDEDISACATRLSCYRNLCSGGANNICCP